MTGGQGSHFGLSGEWKALTKTAIQERVRLQMEYNRLWPLIS